MSHGITLRVMPPNTLMAIVPDEGAQEVSGWSFARVRGEWETWHLVEHLCGEPWISSEIIAIDPKLDLVVTRPGGAFLAGDQVRTAKGPTYRIVGHPADPTPAMLSALQESAQHWLVPRSRYRSWAAMLELPPGDHAGHPDHVVDEWHVVRRTEGVLALGWERPGEWEPVMSGLLVSFDPMTDTAADAGGRTYKLLAPADGFMHPLVEDHLQRMSGPGGLQGDR